MNSAQDKLISLRNRLHQAVNDQLFNLASTACEAAKESAPVDTGELRDKIVLEVKEYGAYAVISTAAHTAIVEYGTTKSPPRPFMQGTANAMQEGLREIAQALRKEVY